MAQQFSMGREREDDEDEWPNNSGEWNMIIYPDYVICWYAVVELYAEMIMGPSWIN